MSIFPIPLVTVMKVLDMVSNSDNEKVVIVPL